VAIRKGKGAHIRRAEGDAGRHLRIAEPFLEQIHSVQATGRDASFGQRAQQPARAAPGVEHRTRTTERDGRQLEHRVHELGADGDVAGVVSRPGAALPVAAGVPPVRAGHALVLAPLDHPHGPSLSASRACGSLS